MAYADFKTQHCYKLEYIKTLLDDKVIHIELRSTISRLVLKDYLCIDILPDFVCEYVCKSHEVIIDTNQKVSVVRLFHEFGTQLSSKWLGNKIFFNTPKIMLDMKGGFISSPFRNSVLHKPGYEKRMQKGMFKQIIAENNDKTLHLFNGA